MLNSEKSRGGWFGNSVAISEGKILISAPIYYAGVNPPRNRFSSSVQLYVPLD